VERLRPVAQADRVAAQADFGPKQKLSGHVPAWANAGHEVASHAVDLSTPWRVTITLQRDAAVQAAFEQLLADQQNPASPMYHQWLTATQIGELYGPTQHDVDALVGWLASQGLKVIDVAPSRMLIDVDGTLGVVSSAFQTSFAYYNLGTAERRAARTEPTVPAVLVPVIGAIGGMAEIYVEPQLHQERLANPEKYQRRGSSGAASPNYTAGSTTYYMTAGDFDTIYDINSVVTGGDTGATIGSLTNSNCPVTTAQCIAIIGRSRVTTADITSYMSAFGGNGQTSFNLTQTAVPSGSGGSDPGISYSADTGEATLDVDRVVGTANGAQAVMVVSATVSGTDGTDIAENYNVNTLMYPVMTVSFGLCEASSSSAQQTSRQTIFSQAAAEGISTFVSAGDSAAAGCDAAFTAPPGSQILSANFLCATGYVTCVGGTEFNDASAYSTYWNSSNSTGGLSAKSYIPEGAWNESVSASPYTVTGTGGGVSTYVAKPTFQTGTGVPPDNFRDTPDVAFSAANHDGYLGYETTSSGGTQGLYINSGTSAAAPGMAAIAALLNTKQGFKAGNLNPLIYKLAATNASAFHDVTVSSSGVSGCSTATPSMCNNSTPGSSSSATGGQAGYAVTAGYDQATGWGSLDVANFLTAAAAANLTVSSAHTGIFLSGSTGDIYTLTVTNSGGSASASGVISVVDALPIGFTATAMSGTGWTCNAGTVTCTQTASLAANTSASAITLTVSVSSSVSGTYSNAVTVSLAGALADTASDSTLVTSILAPTLTMAYSLAYIAVSGTSTLTLTFANPNSTVSGTTLSGVAFSDTFPANAPISAISQFACTSGSTANQTTYTTSTSLTATLAPQGYCLISFTTGSSVAGKYVNTSSTITSTNGGTGSAASATLIVGPQLTATSTHTGNFRAGDSVDTYTLTVSNGNTAVATSGAVTVTDTLPSGFTATAMSGTGWTCTVATVSCTRSDALAASASYPAVTLTVSVSSADIGTYTNSVTASGGGGFSAGSGTDVTVVIGVPTIGESFSPTTVAPNVSSTVTFTLGNPSLNSVTLSGVAFSDSLPTGLIVSSPSGAATTCTSGTVTAVANSGSIALSGATITSGTTCTVTVNVKSASIGSYTNLTGAVSSTTSNAGGTATATLSVTVTPTKLVYTSAPSTPITAGGNAGTVLVALEDAAGNVATNNSSSSITLAVTAPSGYSQTYGATTVTNGVASFNLSGVPLTVAQTYTYTATSSGLTNGVATEVVNPGTATALTVTGLGPFAAPGIAGTATVKALDQYGNVATGFTGTVTLSSTDSSATLPAAYTYVVGDAGVHAFSVTLHTAGTFSVTATQSAPALSGSETGIIVQDAIWLLNATGTYAKLTDAGGLLTTGGTAGVASTRGAVAFDNAGNAWTVTNANSAVYKFTAAGTSASVAGASAAGVATPTAIAIDGGGYVWIADGANVVSVLTNAGAAQSGAAGYGSAAGMVAPSAIAVDSAGGVWVTDKTRNTVVHIMGAAKPVVTPLVNAVKNVTLGTTP
jgi:uncharacterized repeat protein (TIGR01451 family)